MAEELKQSVEEIKEDTLQTTQQEEPQAEATEEPHSLACSLYTLQLVFLYSSEPPA